jgi:HEAT repeat protein
MKPITRSSLVAALISGSVSVSPAAARQTPSAPPPAPARPAPAPRAPSPPGAAHAVLQAPALPPLPETLQPAPLVIPAPPEAPLPPLPDLHLDVPPGVDVEAIRESVGRAIESAKESLRQATESALLAKGQPFVWTFDGKDSETRADALYRQARESIDQGRYERALEQLERLIALPGASRVDAPLYWKAYVLAKEGRSADALSALADLQKRFANSRWLKDARALELEIRQASGQPVSPEALADEDLKLLALRGLMQSDPDRAVAMIERLLAGNGSVRLRENALFVLSQSRSPKAREILAAVAKNGNPDLQLRAVRYLGLMGGADTRQVLDDVYKATGDAAIKRAIIRTLGTSGDRARLSSLARSEPDADLRAEAIRMLGVARAASELASLYRSESSPEVRARILQSISVAGGTDLLIDVARTEKDPSLRRTAIRSLGVVRSPQSADALKAIYAAESSIDIRREIIGALALQQNAAALVDLARSERDPTLKKEIVERLSMMKSKEAADYLLELLR